MTYTRNDLFSLAGFAVFMSLVDALMALQLILLSLKVSVNLRRTVLVGYDSFCVMYPPVPQRKRRSWSPWFSLFRVSREK